ncbi:histidinol dehydrogenase [Paucilactobacillus suebicus]|uniref:Histidinol dehydrogenase n=1 Tax=Paucilactobacillus suebicus DSM 5007 = KCTC 3549 TaxID=1423807 RepID=A0A0R1W3C9_9LACO|nr:histidinol dehydrogenase [Paucilactobacillus suebicus]KRM12353.1 bifunctional histidinal dehydrogenase histidinol dehydrogenase [Paucilactobacillus suebicus DSM 5007 = KCTC 3549]
MKIITDSLESQLKQVSQRTAGLTDPKIEASVREIIENVQAKGDQALRDYEKKFDNVDLTSFRLSDQELTDALDSIDDDLREALEVAKANITSFHKKEIEYGFVDSEKPGVMRGQKVISIATVGLYVPGGTAAYPSSVLMNAIPAKLAGVNRLVMVTPPQKDGINKAVLAAAKLAGVDDVFQIGGAQAIAALAYGTESVPRVDKIFGPGNVFVATAKKMVFGQVAIDMIAGPSEIGVIADDSAKPAQVAADLLSQAEHDKRSRPILVTDSINLANAVSDEVEKQLQTLPREEIARAAVEDQGFIAVLPKVDDMFTLMNAIAPEHLEIQLPNPTDYLAQIKNAGSVFLGRYASEPLGDYVAGPNHILPTSGTARFSSPVGVYDFVKRTQFIQYTSDALAKEADYITKLARVEGLEGHARAIEAREEK